MPYLYLLKLKRSNSNNTVNMPASHLEDHKEKKMIKIILKGSVTLFLVMVMCSNALSKEKTKSEVDTLIKNAGSSSPEWWESVELTYPKTLDISWPVQQESFKGLRHFDEKEMREGQGAFGRRGPGAGPGGPGGFGRSFDRRGGRPGSPREQAGGEIVPDQNAQKIVDQYLIQIVYPNPPRHKEGVKLVNHLMIMHKDDNEKLKRSLNILGYMFYELFDDYARAAFWWQKYSQMGGMTDQVKMARCYFELGSESAAAGLLAQIENSNNKEVIKLWAKIGEVDKALKLIESYSNPANNFFPMGFGGQTRDPQSERYLLAAEICRGAGRHKEAINYYEKVLALPDSYTRPMNHHEIDDKIKAKANLEATRLLKDLDIKRVPDGAYSATTTAYGGPLTVKVNIKKGIIDSVKVTEHLETPSYIVMAEPTARQIVTRQSLEKVDVISGATVTSDAIINSTAKAMFNAMR